MKKKIFLAILTIVILVATGVAYAYFATDVFKTEKEMFFSYILKDETLNMLEDEEISQYFEKQQNSPFTNKGEVSLNYSGEEQNQSLNMLNNSKIAFDGKVDLDKKLSEQTISMNFAQAFTVPIKLKLDGEMVGIQSGFLHNKFIAVRNENLKDLFKKFGVESEEMPDKIEFDRQEFTQEETQELQNKYLTILNENLNEELFSKEKAEKQKILKLDIPEPKFIEILTKILETMRNDELLLNKITGIYTKEEIQQEIDNMIDDLKSIETSEANVYEVKLYIENDKIAKTEINFIENKNIVMNIVIENLDSNLVMKIYEESELLGEANISKQKSENDLIYNISMKIYDEIEGDVEIAFNIGYKNLSNLDDVEETYEIKMISGEEEISVNISNDINFVETVEIEGLNANNAIILNDATQEELQNLLLTIYKNLGLMQ